MARARYTPLFGLVVTGALGAFGSSGEAQKDDGNFPVEPFRIAGNLYYVGASDLASYLLVTPSGHILLDGGLPGTASQIVGNIQRLGFKVSDVKVLVNSHAHGDHAGGLAELKRLSGAELWVSAADAPLLEAGAGPVAFPPVRPDHLIRDGGSVKIGGAEMVAHLTPGHTPGCTTWSTTVKEGGASYRAVFVCSTTVLPDYRLLANPTYPGIASDFEKTFQTLAAMPCDLFLAAHGSFFDLGHKKALLGRQGDNPFVDPKGFQRYVSEGRARFLAVLAFQRSAAARPAH
jgi:metallo-beta-lactamase class B